MQKKLILFVSLLLIFTNSIFANTDSLNTKYGVYGGTNLNSHKADFYKLNGIPNCCPNFENGDGLGFNAGILFEYKLSGSFWLGGRLGIMTLDGELAKEETTTIILDTGPADGVFEHKMTGSFLNAGLEPSIIYNPFDGLLLSAGARLGLNLVQNYDQVETITEPAGYGTFMDSLGNDTHKRTRNEYSGEIPDAIPLQIALTGGISYELRLNTIGSMIIAPELAVYYPLTELVKDTKWRVNSIRAGLALKYLPVPKEEILKEIRRVDTLKIESESIAELTFRSGEDILFRNVEESGLTIITIDSIHRTDTIYYPKKYILDGNVIAVGIDSSGNEIENPVFVIEEFVSNRLDPLLNYVFFEDNSSELPERYKQLTAKEVKMFEIDSLFRDSTLDIYHNMLNIVGRRLTQNPTADITITGCNSGMGDEKYNRQLSEDRAETVKNYLMNTWNISSDRIIVKSRNLPQKASTPKEEADKIAENRRVELSSNDDKILEPVFIKKVDRSAKPPIARFKTEAYAEAGLAEWKLSAYQAIASADKFESEGENVMPLYVDWELEKFQKIIPKSPKSIVYELYLKDEKENDTIIGKKTLPIKVITIEEKRRNRVGDYEIEKFSLILFDFNKSTIEGNNKIIIDFIKSRIRTESEIEIGGYTDRTGNAEYNQKLSARRAESTKTALARPDAKSVGIGEEYLLYNNELPEGRFYCRTVVVTVKTLVK